MGITIHYSGRATSRESISKLLSIAMMFAGQRDWRCAIYEDPLGVYEDVDPENPGLADHELKGPYCGLAIKPHRKCEALSIRFSLSREFSGSTKTQYAPFAIHEQLVELLRLIEPHLDYLNVVDEAGLWETGDTAAAKEQFRVLDQALGALAEGLEEQGMEVEGPDDFYGPDDPDEDAPPERQPYG